MVEINYKAPAEEKTYDDPAEEVKALRKMLEEKREYLKKTISMIEGYKDSGILIPDNAPVFYHKIKDYLELSAREGIHLNLFTLDLIDVAFEEKETLTEEVNVLRYVWTECKRAAMFNHILMGKLEQLEDLLVGGSGGMLSLIDIEHSLLKKVNGEDALAKNMTYDRFYLPRHEQMISQIFDDDYDKIYPFVVTANNMEI